MKKEYKIGEISKIYDLSSDSLRHYEKKVYLILKEQIMGIEYMDWMMCGS